MPTTIKFGKQFAKTPFKLLRKHMRIASESAAFLPDAVQAFFRNDKDVLKETGQSINELAADSHKLLEELQQSLLVVTDMPLERGYLFDILEIQEAIARRMQEITALLLELPMDVPKDMHKPLMRLVDRSVAATEVVYEIVKSIVKGAEGNIKGAQVAAVRKLVQDIVAIETEADACSGDVTRNLFAQCREMDPVTVVFLYQLVGWIDDLADCSEKLAVRAQLLLVR